MSMTRGRGRGSTRAIEEPTQTIIDEGPHMDMGQGHSRTMEGLGPAYPIEWCQSRGGVATGA